MCAINFIWDKKSQLDYTEIEKMNHVLAYRGPDFSGSTKVTLPVGQAYFGHCRLAIMDIGRNGNQPFQSENKNTLIFNGYISNYKHLLPHHAAGDGETLFQALNKKTNYHEFNGMFAFVYYNADEQNIKLVRDRHGIKPLFYYEDENYLIASSEIKGILASGLVQKKFNEKQLPCYFQHRFTQKPETFFESIYELLEGEQITISGNSSKKSFWFEERHQPILSVSDSDLEALIQKSVFDNLQTDVPLGIYLSGGIDSTLLASVAQHLDNELLYTFSIHTEKDPDLEYSRYVAEKLQTQHQEILIDQRIFEHYNQFVESVDQPIADPAFFLSWYLAGESRKTVKTILTGAGADEYFLGYNRHFAYQKIKTGFLKSNFLKSVTKTALSFQNSALSLKLADKIFAPNYDVFSSLYPWTKFENITLTNAQTLEQAIQFDKHFYLPSDILNMTDQSSMAHGLEIRVPFLCNNLTEMANNLPLSYLLKGGKKYLLKKQLDLLGYPSSFINRPKQGFNAPFGDWFRDDFDYYFAFIEETSHPIFKYISKNDIQKLIELHLSKKRELGTELWSVKLLADWLKLNF